MLFAGINAFGNVLEGDDDSHGTSSATPAWKLW